MENLLQFFETIPSSTRTIFLISGLTFFLLLESGIPLFKFKYKKLKHAILNLSLTLMTLVINLIGAGLILKVSVFNSTNYSGIINIKESTLFPLGLQIFLAVILLDFIGAWLIHFLEHRTKWMWKFHIIHHTDQTVDVTTGLRHHPIEAIFRLTFTIIAILISGASIGMVMLYQTISAFSAHFSHANFKTTENLDKLLSWILVTPRFHRIHHHFILPHTDRNFGNIFSIWDRIFKTNTNVGEHEDLKFGLDTHMSKNEITNLKILLIIPFQKNRQH
jgi:sterol desaturase/sphingolipid hydroxylase (fatty acid hydroxylase superfamily)